MPHLESAMLPTTRPATALNVTQTLTLPVEVPTESDDAETPTAMVAAVTATSVQPTVTQTPVKATATQTKATPTVTLTQAPTPEPVLASIDAKEGNGAVFRSAPYLSAKTVVDYTTLLNGVYIKLYETVENEDGEWGHVRLLTDETVEGWILRSLIFVVGSSN